MDISTLHGYNTLRFTPGFLPRAAARGSASTRQWQTAWFKDPLEMELHSEALD